MFAGNLLLIDVGQGYFLCANSDGHGCVSFLASVPTGLPAMATAALKGYELVMLHMNLNAGIASFVFYFGWKMAMVQPVGSWKMVIHPMLGISCGPMWMVAPRERALSVACWMSSTPT